MNSSEYTHLQVKKWRAITYNWDVISSYQQISRLYCLTDFQVAWLLSNTEYMRWSRRWIDCPCTQSDLDAMKADMELNLMSCLDFQPYQLDYMYNDSVNRDFQAYNDRYDSGGIAELNPSSPTTDFNGDGSSPRNTALCLACTVYVKSYVKNWRVQVNLLQQFINVIVGVLSPVPYIQDIAIRVVSGLVGINQTIVDAMNNESAIDDVICCMIDGLTGQAVSEGNFESSLDACGFAFESDSDIVRFVVQQDLDNFDNYLSFVNSLGDAYDYTSKGIIFDCGCDDSWVVEFDFTLSPYDWELFSPESGVWVDGVGWTEVSDDISIKRDVPHNVNFTSFEFTYTIDSIGSGTPTKQWYMQKSSVSGGQSTLLSGNIDSTGDFTRTYNTPFTADDYIRLSLALDRGTVFGSGVITSCRVSGTGDNPFA